MKRVQNPDAAIRRRSIKYVFSNISHLRWSLFCNKVVGQACNLIEKVTPIKVFSCEFHEIFKKNIFDRIPQDE